MEKTYDSKCHALAMLFLLDGPLKDKEQELAKHAHELAWEIQCTIENYIMGLDEEKKEDK